MSTKGDIERDVEQNFRERERPTGNALYFDYEKQVWVRDGRYVRCGHLTPCRCYGRLHEGELAYG